jgi:hypothetical protein
MRKPFAHQLKRGIFRNANGQGNIPAQLDSVLRRSKTSAWSFRADRLNSESPHCFLNGWNIFLRDTGNIQKNEVEGLPSSIDQGLTELLKTFLRDREYIHITQLEER